MIRRRSSLSAEVIAERTRDTDLDKDQRFDQATKDAQHALETIDTDVPIPANTPQSQVDAYKGLLRSSAYSILGTIQYDQEKYADAQGYFQKSIDAYPSQPDPVVVLRLALALDKQGKYPDALKEANRAVELTQDGTAAGTTARHERDRLVQLTGGATPAASSPAARIQTADRRRSELRLHLLLIKTGGRETVARIRAASARSTEIMKPRNISELEQALGYQFSRPELLEQALTHSSQARELESLQAPDAQRRVGDNEQLEFLGDAVLGLITTEELFHRFPHFREGELSKLRAHLVSEKHLIQVARQLELGHYLRLGRGEEKSGGRNKTALLVDGWKRCWARCTWIAGWRRSGGWCCSTSSLRNWNTWRETGAVCRLPITSQLCRKNSRPPAVLRHLTCW